MQKRAYSSVRCPSFFAVLLGELQVFEPIEFGNFRFGFFPFRLCFRRFLIIRQFTLVFLEENENLF